MKKIGRPCLGHHNKPLYVTARIYKRKVEMRDGRPRFLAEFHALIHTRCGGSPLGQNC